MTRWLVLQLILAVGATAQSGYHISKKIQIGGDGGWDYLTVDSTNRRVYVSHTTEVVVLDADAGTIVGRITGLKGVHGIAMAPKNGRGFISNGTGNSITAFDLKTLAKQGDDIPAGTNPDAIIYEDGSNRVFAFNGRSSDATAIDADIPAAVGTVAVDGKPEFAAGDGANAVYVNIEDKNVVLRIDARKLVVEQKWSMGTCESPSGMAMDTTSRRIFSGCHNKQMQVFDANNGHVVATVPICNGIDSTAFDPGTSMIFNSCSDGTITMIHEDTPNKYTVVDTIKTQAGSRTMAVDPKTHKLFVPAAEFQTVEPTAAGGRPQRRMVPGSFSVLVLEK